MYTICTRLSTFIYKMNTKARDKCSLRLYSSKNEIMRELSISRRKLDSLMIDWSIILWSTEKRSFYILRKDFINLILKNDN